MNEELNNLKNSGWILSESGIKSIDLNSNTKKNLIKTLLDRDLREIGAGLSDLHKGKFENIEHELVVLQIMKIRNISAPKANENSKTAPKLLKIQLTDGQNTYSAIEMEQTALSLETRPGTKICLKVKQLKYANGQLLLTPKNMEILGGYVEALASKWEISRSLANQMKGNRSNAAPPFIPFGQKIQQSNLPHDKGFKSLQQNKPKEGEENSEFNAQRQDAIAEASKAATRKKTFGGGNKTLVDSNVQKIMDKGYTEEQATTALKYVNNNVERALQNLKRREERQQQRAGSNDYNNARENPKDNKRGGGKNAANNSSDLPPAKPSTGVSLFDFLENKIPESTSTVKATQSSSSSHAYNERFENNISSSFRKHDKDNSNKSQWSQYSSSNENHKSSQNYNQKNSYNTRNDYRNNGDGNDRREQYKGDYRKYDRESRDGPRESSSRYNQQQPSNYSSKPNNANNSSSYSKPSSQQQQSQSINVQSQKPNIQLNNSSGNGANNYSNSNNKFEKSRYGQQQQQQKSDYNNRDNRGHTSSKDYNNFSKEYPASGANNSNYNSKYEKPQRANSDMYQKQNDRRLVESMDKMSLKTNHQSQQSSQHHHSYKSSSTAYESHDPSKASSYQPSLSTNEPKQSYSKNQGNYPIVGFQNKEANEQAKNALKTKSIPAAPKWQSQQQQQTAQAPPPQPQAVPIQMISQTHSKGQPPAPFASSTNGPPLHSLQPQPFVQHPVLHPMPTAVITANPPPAAVFHATPITYQTPIIMQSVQAPPIQVAATTAAPTGIQQQLKVGDLCLAKYWEDGKFYNAKITNVSESTYVVLFTDYGNAEEVRKNDCVPLTIMPTCPTPPQPMTNFVQTPPQMGSFRITTTPQHQHNYQQPQQQSMPYKPSGGKHQRRN
ncbi:hypothetical protein PVAND_012238 [Polypedilum vanderplanki]|uniref:Tudor domain-containing protein 3 n=1 Tax=Polypedilum vanderplanki TaxID=319348 RepID=A0A9J6CLU0_POLVA|nr:hypothetical protein PVAND_012238 [Polypedilum vanderplanki]